MGFFLSAAIVLLLMPKVINNFYSLASVNYLAFSKM
jgi:hypothetical protein